MRLRVWSVSKIEKWEMGETWCHCVHSSTDRSNYKLMACFMEGWMSSKKCPLDLWDIFLVGPGRGFVLKRTNTNTSNTRVYFTRLVIKTSNLKINKCYRKPIVDAIFAERFFVKPLKGQIRITWRSNQQPVHFLNCF